MKTRFLCFLLVFLAFSCKNDDTLIFETITYSGDTCADCTKVKITIPKALGDTKINKVVNTALKEELVYLLNFKDEQDAVEIETAISSFTKGYTDLQLLHAEEATPWEANVNWSVSYENKEILTIKLDSYLFTGGAHGYNTTHYLNFDKLNAIELNTEDLFKNTGDFENYVETKFRLQEAIPTGGDINSTGFMFETGLFYLPQNIGYTKEGIQFFYEQYEIASYADGSIMITIPYSELKKYLVFNPSQK